MAYYYIHFRIFKNYYCYHIKIYFHIYNAYIINATLLMLTILTSLAGCLKKYFGSSNFEYHMNTSNIFSTISPILYVIYVVYIQ